MLDAEDASVVIALIDEKVVAAYETLMEMLEDQGLCDADDILNTLELEDVFEDLSTANQKAVELGLRKGLKAITSAVSDVLEEIATIDAEVLGEEKEEEEADDDDDEEDD